MRQFSLSLSPSFLQCFDSRARVVVVVEREKKHARKICSDGKKRRLAESNPIIMYWEPCRSLAPFFIRFFVDVEATAAAGVVLAVSVIIIIMPNNVPPKVADMLRAHTLRVSRLRICGHLGGVGLQGREGGGSPNTETRFENSSKDS